MRLPAAPLTPIAVALAVTVAGHLAVQVAAVGFPSGGRYQAPDPIPPMASVTHVGSPANNSLYSGVRRYLMRRHLRTSWSTSSCASTSVSLPAAMSRSM